MRNLEQVRLAHELLGSFVRELPPDADPVLKASVYSALSAMCWVLGHDKNEKFRTNLESLKHEADADGFFLRGTYLDRVQTLLTCFDHGMYATAAEPDPPFAPDPH